MNQTRVLVLLNNIPLYGSERGNINVFYLLKKKKVLSLFVTHEKYGHIHINPHLENLNLKHVPAAYIGKICRRDNLSDYFMEIKNSIKGSIQLIKIIREFKPDYIHIPTEASFLSMFVALYLNNIPVIFRLGDIPRSNRKLFVYLWKSVIIPRVYKFVCISHFIKSKLISLGVDKDKIEVIYNTPPARQNKDHKYILENSNSFNVTYIGQIIEEKGIRVLITAAIRLCKEFENIYFNLAGDYEWKNDFAVEMIRIVEKEKLSGRIRFLGMIEDIPGLLSSSQLHVCPSLCAEALSNVTVEAKAAGVPSVIFPSGGLPELIRHQVDGYICKTSDEEELINGIMYFYNNPDERMKAGIAAKQSMTDLGLNKEIFLEKWNSVYNGQIN